MHWNRIVTSLALILVLLAPPLLACSGTTTVRIRLPKFAQGAVDGVWFYRLDASSYERVCRFEISDPFVQGGQEVVTYVQSCLDGRPKSPAWVAEVTRLSSDPNTVELAFVYQLWTQAPATHKASSYNAAGESALSSSTLVL